MTEAVGKLRQGVDTRVLDGAGIGQGPKLHQSVLDR